MLRSKEWPLIGFTLLAQVVAGLFAVMVVLCEGAALDMPADLQIAFMRWSLVIGLGLLAAGTVIAASHLGQKLKLYRVIYNLESSSLSREMLLGGLFGGAVALLTLLVFVWPAGGILHTLTAYVGLLLGISLVAVIARVYLIRTVPAWNTPITPISFFLAALLLGGSAGLFLWVALNIQLNARIDTALPVAQALGVLLVILITVQLVLFLLHLVNLQGRGRAALASLHTVTVTKRPIFILRIALPLLAQGLLLLVVSGFVASGTPGALLVVSGVALLLIWGGELFGRYLFYESHQRIGL